MNQFKLLTGLVTVLVVSACKSIGPVDVHLRAEQNSTLTDKQGRPIYIDAGRVYETKAYLDGRVFFRPARLVLTVNDQIAFFQNVSYERSSNSFFSHPKKSGQRSANGEALGLNFSYKKDCDSRGNCELLVKEETIHRRCTYYQRRLREHCYYDHYYNLRCYNEWETFPVYGLERVKLSTYRTTYSYTGTLFGESSGTLASYSGNRDYFDTYEHILSSCR